MRVIHVTQKVFYIKKPSACDSRDAECFLYKKPSACDARDAEGFLYKNLMRHVMFYIKPYVFC